MTDARDELAGLIGRCVDRHLPGIPMGPVQSFMVATADAILAAGWRAPLPTRWDCGHVIAVGAWGHNGECISCAHKRWGADAEDDMS